MASTVFSERLRMLRSKAQESQTTLAKVVGVSQNAIGSWERAEASPPVPELAKLAAHFAVSADYLIGRSDSPTGLRPDHWILDLDALELGSTPYALKVPTRHRIVAYSEYERLRRARRLDEFDA